MKKRYYVSDRIYGGIFTSRNQLERYYKKATKEKGLSCGNVKIFDSKKEVNDYINYSLTHKNYMWRECLVG